MGCKDRFNTLCLAQFFENGEYTVADYLMVIERECLGDYHIRKITAQSIAPKIADVFGAFGILRDISPMVGDLHTEISRTAMYCQPADTGFGVFSIFDEMVAATECAEAFVEDSFLKFDAVAEIGDKPGVYAWDFIDKVRSSGAAF